MPNLDSARQKLDRALKHIGVCEIELGEFFPQGPYRRTHYSTPDGQKWSKVELTGMIPPNLIGSVADAVHNLRSALDHLAFAAAEEVGVNEAALRNLYFPIRESATLLKNALCEKPYSEMGHEWRAFVIGLEPYHGGAGDNLHRINALDRLDKHRRLIDVSPFVELYAFDGSGDLEHIRTSRLEVNQTIATQSPAYFKPNLQFADVGNSSRLIIDEDSGFPLILDAESRLPHQGLTVSEELGRFARAVSDVLVRAATTLPYFACQTEQIPPRDYD